MAKARRINILVTIMVIALSCFMGAQISMAGPYPERTIKLVCGYNPGGPSSSIATLVAKKVSEFLEKPMVVEHRPGAGATLGATYVANADPDGYTLFMGSDSNITVAPLVNPNVHYSLEDFAPITGIAMCPVCLNVLPGRWKNMEELIADAKKRPNKITYATQGANSYAHLAMIMLCKKAGIELKMIPLQGVAKTTTGLLGGHIDIGVVQMGHLYEAGKVKILAVAEPKRLPNLPNVPTLTELGYPVVSNGAFFMLAPKGTPQPILDKLDTAFKKAFKKGKTEFEQILAKFQMFPQFLPPEQVMKQNIERRAMYREAAQIMGVLVKGR